MSDALRFGPDGPPIRKATVLLTAAEEMYIAQEAPEIKWTGLGNTLDARARKRLRQLLARKQQQSSKSGPHTVQGGLPELGRRR